VELNVPGIVFIKIRGKSVPGRLQLLEFIRPVHRKHSFAYVFGSAMLYQLCRPWGRTHRTVIIGIIERLCEHWLYRTLRQKHKRWTEEETERTKKLWPKGCQVWEIAHHLGRPDVFVRRNLKIHEELRGILRPVKT
jgi:hypothetical protein